MNFFSGVSQGQIFKNQPGGTSGINPSAGEKPRHAKKPVRFAQALQKVIGFNLGIYLCVCLFLSISF
jgi:hypothetical protein